jgi:hypothetical protein
MKNKHIFLYQCYFYQNCDDRLPPKKKKKNLSDESVKKNSELGKNQIMISLQI